MRHVDQVAILIKHNAVTVEVASREGVGHIGGISGNEENGRSSPASPWTRGPRRQQPKASANCQGDHIQGEHEGDRLRGNSIRESAPTSVNEMQTLRKKIGVSKLQMHIWKKEMAVQWKCIY